MIVPGFQAMPLLKQGLAIPTVTVTPGMATDGTDFDYYGYSTGFFFPGPIGSISQEPFPGATCNTICDTFAIGGGSYSGSTVAFTGDFVAALAGYDGLEVNGVRVAFTGSWALFAGSTFRALSSGMGLKFGSATVKLVP